MSEPSGTSGSVDLSYVADGDPQAPALLMGSSIGTTHRMWDPQAPALAHDWRVIRFDARGHGGSPAPAGPYEMAGLAGDVIALADQLGLDRFAYCGLSMGGAIGLQLAVDHPARLTSLVVCCASAWFGGPAPWQERAQRVRGEGMGWLVEASRARWFRPTAQVPPIGLEALAAQRDIDPEGYASCCEALAQFDLRDRLSEIQVPVTVIAGADDVATPGIMTQALADGIPGSTLTVIEGAAHLASLEQPAAVLDAIQAHVARHL